MTREATAGRAVLFRWLRITVTLAAFAVIFTRQPTNEVWAAWRSLSPRAFLGALFFVFVSVSLAAFRWRALLAAYGAVRPPTLWRLLHLYLVGLFYNSYIPGAVGGDVVRGVASREAFGDDPLVSTTGALAVVFVGRVCGVAALLVISAGAFVFWPIEGVEGLWLWATLGLVTVVVAVVGLAAAPKLAPRFSGRVGSLLGSIPVIERSGPLAAALLLSLGVQFANVLAGHAIVGSLAPTVTLADSAVAMPLIGASAFFPLTISGAGVREFAFAALYHLVGVPEATAYAASLSYWAAQLAVAAVGGILTLVTPISKVTTRADA